MTTKDQIDQRMATIIDSIYALQEQIDNAENRIIKYNQELVQLELKLMELCGDK